MNKKFWLSGFCSAFCVMAAQSQTPTGGQSTGSGGAAAGQGPVNANSSVGAQNAPVGVGSDASQGVPPLPGANNSPPQVPGRDQLPLRPQNREPLPPSFAGRTNNPGNPGGIGMTNQFGAGTNGFGLTNQFGTRSNRFGFTNEIGGRSNRFGFTNEFGSRSNRFRSTNGFGSRSNRFGTNEFGQRTNRFFTNELGFTNRFDLSNDIEIGFGTNLPAGDVGFLPGGVVGGGTTAVPVPGGVPSQGNLAPTGQPGATNRVYATNSAVAERTGVTLRDRAVTEDDRTLLVNLRQFVTPRLEAMGAWAPAIHFWVRDGLVRMVGAVQTPEIKNEAERMTRLLPGVVTVENQLHVGTVDPNASDVDEALVFQVRQSVLPQLTANGSKPRVDFSARGGVVTIMGKTATPEESAQVAKLVQQVPGVAQVRNEALVTGANAASSSESLAGRIEIPAEGSTNLAPTGRTNQNEQPLVPKTESGPAARDKSETPPDAVKPIEPTPTPSSPNA